MFITKNKLIKEIAELKEKVARNTERTRAFNDIKTSLYKLHSQMECRHVFLHRTLEHKEDEIAVCEKCGGAKHFDEKEWGAYRANFILSRESEDTIKLLKVKLLEK